MHQKGQSAEECGEEGREEKGRERSRKLGLTEYKRDKIKRQKSRKNGNKESVPQQMWRDISNIL
jgi:hypothetical protein